MRTRGLSALLILSFAFLAACNEKPGDGAQTDTPSTKKAPRVAFVTNGVASFWTIAQKGAEAAGQATGANVTVHMPAEGISSQKQILEDLVTKGVDGIAVSPIDPANQTELLDMIATRTNLITHDSDAPDSDRLCYVGMDNYTAGRMCGQLVKEALPDGGNVYIFIGRLEQDNAKKRRQGVIDELLDREFQGYDSADAELEGNGYTILDTRTDQFDQNKAKANAEDAIALYPDLDCMVGLFAYNAPNCLEAVAAADKLGQIRIVSFDEQDATLQGIQDGHIQGTVSQNPFEYGYHSVRILKALLDGDETVLPEDGVLEIEPIVVRQADVARFWSELKARMERGRAKER
jgi:ribose transport system substrate-binding protein